MTTAASQPAPARPDRLQPQDILYRDDRVLVVNKPAGVPVHGSRILEGRPDTLYAMARRLTGSMVHAVHRLDRPVSGALLLALDKEMLALLSRAFETRRVRKGYLGIVRGWPEESGLIDHPLLPPRDERRRGAEPREAVTRFDRLARVALPIELPPYPEVRYSLLALNPLTGRRHQLRRHMKHASHHLLGDTTYGRGEHNRLVRAHFGCHRLMLHSRLLAFRHPVTNEEITLSAPLDEAFGRLCEAFGWSADPGPPPGWPYW